MVLNKNNLPSYHYSWRPNKLRFSEMHLWLLHSLKMFIKKPVTWLFLSICVIPFYLLLEKLAVSSALLFFGCGVLSLLLVFMFYASLHYCAHAQFYFADFNLKDLATGLRLRFKELLTVGSIATFWILAMILLSLILGSIFGAWQPLKDLQALGYDFFALEPDALLSLGAWLLVVIFLCLPVLMATIFVPPLVVLCSLDPVNAIRASFFGVMKNFFVLLLTMLVLITLFIVMLATPKSVGLFLFLPLAFLAWFQIFKSIYTVELKIKESI